MRVYAFSSLTTRFSCFGAEQMSPKKEKPLIIKRWHSPHLVQRDSMVALVFICSEPTCFRNRFGPLKRCTKPGRPVRPGPEISCYTPNRSNFVPEINLATLNDLVGKIKQGALLGAVYHEKYPPASYQSGPSCGMYSLKWAVDYRAMKTGVKGELLPARARDVCANCGTGLRGGLDEDIFEQDAVALRTALDQKKFY